MGRRTPYLFALLSALFFGAATPLSKWLLTTIGPVQLSGLLYLGAAVGVLPLLWREKSFRPVWKMPRPTQKLLLGAVFCGGLLGPVFLLIGLEQAASASVSLWLNLEAVATALLGYFFFRDKLHQQGWLGAGCLLVASLLLSWGEGAAGWQAGLWVAAACVCWGFDNHWTAMIDGITPAQSTLWKGAIAGTFNLLLGLTLEPVQFTGWQVAAALLLGVFAYGFSITLYITSAQQLGATRSQLLFSTAPYFGLGLAVLLLQESLSLVQWGAAGLVTVAVLLLTLEWHSHEHTHHPLAHEHWHRHDDGHHNHTHNEPVAGWHTHPHTHTEVSHQHRHLPDLHHRHDHA